MKYKTLADLPEVRVLGRTNGKRSPAALFWTGSGIDLIYDGGELWLIAEADFLLFEPWISVELNGAWIARMPLRRGCNEICLFRGLAQGKPKHVRVFKEMQAMNEDSRHRLLVLGLRYDSGRFAPLPVGKRRLEFIGDSITCGEGVIGAPLEQEWASVFFSVTHHYALLTADALDAELRLVSESGWGVLCGWDNNPRTILPPYYERVCGLATGAANRELGAQEPYDFAAWPADAVIVNLGTNDDNAFTVPEWKDARTGERFKLHLLENGAYAPVDALRVRDAVMDMIRLVRRCNPRAKIVWVNGMMGDRIYPVLQAALAEYQAQTGDQDALLFKLPGMTPETFGPCQHPGPRAHQAAAEALVPFLRGQLEP